MKDTLTPLDRLRLQRFYDAYDLERHWPALQGLDWRGCSRLVWLRWLVNECGEYRDDVPLSDGDRRSEYEPPSLPGSSLMERLLSPFSCWLSSDSLS